MSIISMLRQLGEGMISTVIIFAATLIFSLPLGLIVSMGRMSKIKLLKYVVKVYISIMRGTPLILQIMVVYYGPYYIFKIPISTEYQIIAVIIAFSVNYAAYFSEIFRSGIESISKGQYEAAEVLGYSKSQTFFRIILPQVIKRVLPPITNETITLVKDTSLSMVIAYSEMFTIAKRISSTESNVIPLFAAGVFYYIFNFLVAFVMEKIEKAFNYYR